MSLVGLRGLTWSHFRVVSEKTNCDDQYLEMLTKAHDRTDPSRATTGLRIRAMLDGGDVEVRLA